MFRILRKFCTEYDIPWKIAERISIVLWILAFFWAWFTLFKIVPDINEAKNDLQIIQEKLNTNDAESVLYSYFYDIEQGNLQKAYDALTEQKQQNNSFEQFSSWLEDFENFEGLKITELKEKQSASKKVFLVEFNFKKKWYKPVKSIWWMYLVYKDSLWKIDYSNVLYENGYKNWACEFYKFIDYCK